MSPTRVLLLRHAESADPTIFHGAESDVDLSPRGRRQAERIADHLKTLSPVVVVSSAMRRALETARPIAGACGVGVEVEALLHERRVGPTMSGTPTGDPSGPWPATLRRWLAGETWYAPPGAESFDDIRERVVPVWRGVTERHEGRTFAVVAHGMVIRVLLASVVEGLSLADWQRLGPMRNVAISELVREGGGPWRAARVNDLPDGVGE
jgi:probable phosphoglycerate mutase